MIRAQGVDTVEVSKVKGHATEADVDQGRVRMDDRHGNDEAETAADLGRRHQSEAVMHARRALLQARDHWYPIMLQLHRFMVAVSWVRLILMIGVGRRLIPLSGIKGPGKAAQDGSWVILILDAWAAWFLAWALGSGSWWLYHRCRYCCLALQRWPAVQAFFPFWELCIGLLGLLIWDTLVFLMWRL